jgi:hypothetical protein
VHHKEVDLSSVEIRQRFIQSTFNIIRMIVVAPEFGGEGDLLTSDAVDFDAMPDLLLDPCGINQREAC